MSDSIFNDESQVDPRLDALLSRTLGRGGLPYQQHQRHLERLGITPRLGGSAGTWRAPVVAGRPPSSSTPQPESFPIRRRRRQWLELGAAALAIIVVGALLVALFRDWSGGEDDQQLAASPEATNPPVTVTPRETREQLYVVSHAARRGQDVLITEGRVSAIDPETGEEFWSVEAGLRIDSILSPDGKRLFVADSQREGDFVYALDTQTGHELWRQPIENRQWMQPATGQSMLSVSPDGATLSVYTCEGCTGEIRSNTGRNWLARFNAMTGNRQDDLEITACRGTTILGPASPASQPLYVICDTSQRLEIIDLTTGQPTTLTYDQRPEGGFPETTGINASVVSPDGWLLYLASGNRLTVIDMTRHSARRVQLTEDINVERRLPLLALSPDGERLYIGSLDTTAFDQGRAEVNRVDVYDTTTWEPLGQLTTSYPLNGQAFDTAPDGNAVYGTFIAYPGSDDNTVESRILRHTLTGEPMTVTTRQNEEVLYLFAGTVEVDPDAEPLPTPTPEPTVHERLFAVSDFTQSGQGVAGRVSAYDAVSGEIVYRIDTGVNPDAVLSPDGTRLYIIANSDDGDRLTSHDALTGDELWSIPIENRVQWQFGEGPTTMAVSRDSLLLYVYSASAPGNYTIQVFDATNGRPGEVIDGVAGCTAQLFPSVDYGSLYVVCLNETAAPQVIDLETMTSAGVMQGFGGIVTGAAASADGRYLYVTHDIDTELRLTVIDMNARTISTQRDIVHMDRDPLHSLNITAVSPDGSRLFIGLGSEPEGEEPVADQVWVWDTTQLHTEPLKIRTSEPINGWSLAPGPDNSSVFAIHNEDGPDAGGQPSNEAIIMRLSVEGGSDEFVRQWSGDILRVFSGRVTSTTIPPAADAGEPRLIDELTIPADLPLGLTLTSASSGSDFAELTFTGDDALVVEIDVERWDGEPLDAPARSTPFHLGNLSAYIIPDPEGGWPRGVYWHDSRFVYNLSVISGPPDGWTQDDAIAVMLAFSSPADALVCPTTPWADLEGRDANLLPEAYWIKGDGLALGHLDGRLVEGENRLAWVVDSRGIVDPDTSARVMMRGIRLGTTYQQSIPLELRDYAIEYNAVIDGGVEHHIDSTFIFPTSGCWQIEAEFGGRYLMTIVHVELDTTPDLAAIWDILRWRPLHELGIDSTPPCLRMPARQVFADFGPLVGDMQINGGPVYLNGPDENGAITLSDGASADGGYYQRVMLVTGGDYTGPLLVRPSPGSGPIGFTNAAPDSSPASEWQLSDPAGTSPTPGVRHWIVYLRFDGPGCHALQIDGLDFSSIIVFEVVAEGGV